MLRMFVSIKKFFFISFVSVLCLSTFSRGVFSQEKRLSLIFIGDIMGHGPQIRSAYDSAARAYNYNPVFEKVYPVFKQADFVIANLEVTLGGAPYSGYPRFSSPDELAVACKENGIEVLMTANNHACDRGEKGILRTIKTLDSLGIKHTGAFENPSKREKNNLLILDKNDIKIGLLNYTYGTNGIPLPYPAAVNLIDTITIKNDLLLARRSNLDKIVVFIHWGNEYESTPSAEQLKTADFLQRNGVDIIIGSHPHVLQKMEYDADKGKFVAYSLGNFVSNQRERRKDGGAMVKIELAKNEQNTRIADVGYSLVWTHKYDADGKVKFSVLPAANASEGATLAAPFRNAMQTFLQDSRRLLDGQNKNVREANLIP